MGRAGTPAQLDGLSAFFQSGPFARVAALLSQQTELSVPNHRYELTALALLDRINEVAPVFWPFSSVHVVIESSTRGNPLAVRYFAAFQEVRVDVDDQTRSCPVQMYFAAKSAGLAGLEVADFVVQGGWGRGPPRCVAPRSRNRTPRLPGGVSLGSEASRELHRHSLGWLEVVTRSDDQ